MLLGITQDPIRQTNQHKANRDPLNAIEITFKKLCHILILMKSDLNEE